MFQSKHETNKKNIKNNEEIKPQKKIFVELKFVLENFKFQLCLIDYKNTEMLHEINCQKIFFRNQKFIKITTNFKDEICESISLMILFSKFRFF